MIEVHETVWIPMPDGINLAARLWLPTTALQSPVPAILEYIPYRRRDRTRMRDESMHPHFAEAGYASIRVDMRGSGDSDGVMLDEYTQIEIEDGASIIGWIAAQQWCDGNVGMFGKSWGAYSSFQVAALKPPALKAIAPVMGTDDRWLEDVHYYGGVLAGDNFWWGSCMQLINAYPPDPAIVGKRWRTMWRQRLDAMSFWPAQWLEHQTHDETWRRGSISENYDDVEIPVYFFGGWADLFRDTPFRIAEYLGAETKIVMGPWAHLYPHEAIPDPKIDFLNELTRFWDHHLKGEDTGIMNEPRFRFFLQDSTPPSATQKYRSGIWFEESVWPSSKLSPQRLYLNESGLDFEPRNGPDLSVCSPQTFGSAGGDMGSFAIPGDMPTDCRIDAAGALMFRGSPIETPIHILGQPTLSLAVKADKPQAFVVVLLVDEAPEGAQTLISRGFCNLTHRQSDTHPTPVVPGEQMHVRVPLHGIGYRLAKGHRLMVQIASTYWPILWPSPEPVTLSIATGQSAITLPILTSVQEATRRLEAPAAPSKRPAERQVRAGSMERSLKVDLTTGVHNARFFLDGGVFGPAGEVLLEETGTVMGHKTDRNYSIHPSDPLSAQASMTQEAHLTRDDWHIRIETTSKMKATKDKFHLSASTTCWDGETQFHSVEWNHEFERNGV